MTAPDEAPASLRWYPPAWRERYGAEVAAYMADRFGPGGPPLRARLSLIGGGLRERARLGGDHSPAERVRSGALLVLGAWAAFVVAGTSFAKFSEHFDGALPSGARPVPDGAYTLLQGLAATAGLLVLAGAVVAVPSFVRFLRSGGRRSARRPIVAATACSLLAMAGSVPLVRWSHHLTGVQRNGGLPWYGAALLAWAALLALCLCLWTAAAVVVARRLSLTRRVLAAEAALAVGVTVAMAVMVGATAVWWAAMALHAPSFTGSGPGGLARAPVDPWLAATVVLMVLAVDAAALGTVRIIRSWPAVRGA